MNIEALACGTPVLAFKTGGNSEIIDNSCALAVDCDGVATLKKKIDGSVNKKHSAQIVALTGLLILIEIIGLKSMSIRTRHICLNTNH